MTQFEYVEFYRTLRAILFTHNGIYLETTPVSPSNAYVASYLLPKATKTATTLLLHEHKDTAPTLFSTAISSPSVNTPRNSQFNQIKLDSTDARGEV